MLSVILFVLLITSAIVLGVFIGYFLAKANYEYWEEELEKKESYLSDIKKRLKNEWEELEAKKQELKSELESLQIKEELLLREKERLEELMANKEKLEKIVQELEEEVKELQDRKDLVASTVKQVEREYEELIEEEEKLEKEVNRLKEIKAKLKKDIKLIIRKAEQKAHENLVRELRSLRAQKSAVLDLFDKYPELEEFLRKKEGLGIREYLERAKKLRAKTKNKGE